ncbi:hypothetical protein DFA_05201 [Cavenderia fasciculata]|uniref:Uncharacterized protein n=1 Tax=Cavenderia fasciculata TaxID=261658 RepID=F4PNL8_CACFS|nr:uncharacterized protein DFA_05201 [Cavenderia fasciculata]EGG23071.1 hypothetical protein DFA_05201 [Cavenderia fasciculata]|eukprot:XP_004360922.1 hypothetical protein DFA_05201 [Cavenderia fasciculata]
MTRDKDKNYKRNNAELNETLSLESLIQSGWESSMHKSSKTHQSCSPIPPLPVGVTAQINTLIDQFYIPNAHSRNTTQQPLNPTNTFMFINHKTNINNHINIDNHIDNHINNNINIKELNTKNHIDNHINNTININIKKLNHRNTNNNNNNNNNPIVEQNNNTSPPIIPSSTSPKGEKDLVNTSTGIITNTSTGISNSSTITNTSTSITNTKSTISNSNSTSNVNNNSCKSHIDRNNNILSIVNYNTSEPTEEIYGDDDPINNMPIHYSQRTCNHLCLTCYQENGNNSSNTTSKPLFRVISEETYQTMLKNNEILKKRNTN